MLNKKAINYIAKYANLLRTALQIFRKNTNDSTSSNSPQNHAPLDAVNLCIVFSV